MSVTSKNNFGRLRTAYIRGAREAQEKIADRMVEIAQEEVPVLSGDLKRSIKKQRATAFRVYAVAEEPYAVHVNDGTRFMAGNPFWNRAEDRVRSEIGPTTVKIIRDKVRRVAR